MSLLEPFGGGFPDYETAARAAAAGYGDEPAGQGLRRLDLAKTLPQLDAGFVDGRFFVNGAAAAAVLRSDDHPGLLIVSIRGTDDLATDGADYGAMADGSYWEKFAPLLDALAQASGDRRVVFVGHSLGGGAVNNLAEAFARGDTPDAWDAMLGEARFYGFASPVTRGVAENLFNFGFENEAVYHGLSTKYRDGTFNDVYLRTDSERLETGFDTGPNGVHPIARHIGIAEVLQDVDIDRLIKTYAPTGLLIDQRKARVVAEADMAGGRVIGTGDAAGQGGRLLLVLGEDRDDEIAASGRVKVAAFGLGGDDFLSGSARDDVLFGDGPDWARIAGGRDTLEGGAGADTLYGGAGRDRLDGGDGDDLLIGGTGRDRFIASLGDDVVRGDDGPRRGEFYFDTLDFSQAEGLRRVIFDPDAGGTGRGEFDGGETRYSGVGRIVGTADGTLYRGVHGVEIDERAGGGDLYRLAVITRQPHSETNQRLSIVDGSGDDTLAVSAPDLFDYAAGRPVSADAGALVNEVFGDYVDRDGRFTVKLPDLVAFDDDDFTRRTFVRDGEAHLTDRAVRFSPVGELGSGLYRELLFIEATDGASDGVAEFSVRAARNYSVEEVNVRTVTELSFDLAADGYVLTLDYVQKLTDIASGKVLGRYAIDLSLQGDVSDGAPGFTDLDPAQILSLFDVDARTQTVSVDFGALLAADRASLIAL